MGLDRFLVASTATAGAGTSPVLDLGDAANASGEDARVLRLDVQALRNGGGFTSVLVQQASDGSTFTTLWSVGTLGSQTTSYIYLYTWSRYLRLSFSYAVDTAAEDAGGRFKVRARAFGLPSWESSYPCRWSHCEALRPSWFAVADGFPGQYDLQRQAAKRMLEQRLKGAGIDPQTLFTDGDANEPVPVGLENAGAYATLLLVHADAGFPRGDAWQQEHEALTDGFNDAFELAIASGLMLEDIGSGVVTDDAGAYSEPRLGR